MQKESGCRMQRVKWVQGSKRFWVKERAFGCKVEGQKLRVDGGRGAGCMLQVHKWEYTWGRRFGVRGAGGTRHPARGEA